MTPDEISEGLEFDQQLKDILFKEDGITPKPTGLIDLVQFVAKETRYTRLTVERQKAEFTVLLEEHKRRVVDSLPCVATEPETKTSKAFDKVKVLYSIIGVGGVLLLIVILLLLRDMGFKF